MLLLSRSTAEWALFGVPEAIVGYFIVLLYCIVLGVVYWVNAIYLKI